MYPHRQGKVWNVLAVVKRWTQYQNSAQLKVQGKPTCKQGAAFFDADAKFEVLRPCRALMWCTNWHERRL